jgi:hypothetical protein
MISFYNRRRRASRPADGGGGGDCYAACAAEIRSSKLEIRVNAPMTNVQMIKTRPGLNKLSSFVIGYLSI